MLLGFMPSHKTQETANTKDATKSQDNPKQLSFETLLFPPSEYGAVAEARASSEIREGTQEGIEARFRVYAPIFAVRLVHVGVTLFFGENCTLRAFGLRHFASFAVELGHGRTGKRINILLPVYKSQQDAQESIPSCQQNRPQERCAK
jgi:hypothetical protein